MSNFKFDREFNQAKSQNQPWGQMKRSKEGKENYESYQSDCDEKTDCEEYESDVEHGCTKHSGLKMVSK